MIMQSVTRSNEKVGMGQCSSCLTQCNWKIIIQGSSRAGAEPVVVSQLHRVVTPILFVSCQFGISFLHWVN